MCPKVEFSRLRSLKYTVVAGFTLLATGALYAQSTDQGDVAALKAQMERMQKQYEQRISAMEGQMKALESKADSGSILNTRILTDADGKEMQGGAPPGLDESFLKSLTRNFTFSAYVRAGVQFNGNGGGGNFSFSPPDPDGGRPRLGNENDTYFELTWAQAHLLGDSPDVMDASMTFTPAFRYVQSRNTFTSSHGGIENSGNDFDIVWRQAFLEMKNVFKTAPEITFWGGQRFYDRFNIDPNDFFYLDTSGYGAGVYNIDVGIGKLAFAYLGGLNDNFISQQIGSFYKHTFDLRLKNIDIGFGKLMLVLIGNYEKGATFEKGYDTNGNIITLTNPLKTSDAWGIGGGFVWQYDFGNKSFLQLYALGGRGATNFSAGDDFGTISGKESAFLANNPNTPAGEVISAGRAIDKMLTVRAGGQFIWNPNPCFSLGVWAFWNLDNSGFGEAAIINNVLHHTTGRRNMVEGGIRPIVWLTDNIAIQGQAWGSYQDNTRVVGAEVDNHNAFGRSGEMGVFTIAPTIKPKGGYFTRPELRVFATWAIWSHSLRGATSPYQESGSTFAPPYNGNTNQGWLFGTQVEWFF